MTKARKRELEQARALIYAQRQRAILNRMKFKVLEDYLEDRDNSFIESILNHLNAGRTLSEKQNHHVRRTLYQAKMHEEADLFKDKPATGETAKAKKVVKKKAPAKKKVAKKKVVKKKTANPIEGMKFVITGKLPSMGRAEATEIIKDNGGKVAASISKNTNYLLSGEKTGTKLDKAKALGIKVITEQKFLKMLPQ
jgi:NAD-dependent DNA ligase